MIELLFPRMPFPLMVSVHPHFDGREHSHDLFFAHFEGTSESMMRRAVGPRGLEPVLLAQQKTGRLRTANAFAAAVSHRRCAALQVDVGLDGQNFGGGIHDYRN